MKFTDKYTNAMCIFDEAKRDSPKNCSECKFAERGATYCKKYKEVITPFDWCVAGKRK